MFKFFFPLDKEPMKSLIEGHSNYRKLADDIMESLKNDELTDDDLDRLRSFSL